MNDRTVTWRDLLYDLDEQARQRERVKLEAMTPEQREMYLRDQALREMVNMP